MVPVIFDSRYLDYDFGPEHPFSPLRLAMLQEMLLELGAWQEPVPAQIASREEILSIHAERYVKRVEAVSRGEPVSDAQHYGLGTGDIPIFAEMDQASRWLVGGTLTAARTILAGAPKVLQFGGGLHHAGYDQASGFCIYNDLACAIRYFRSQGLRVAYLDVDVHHGDGVQALFYEDPEVLTISLHESGRYLFPGTGGIYELGRGAGLGKKLNIPLDPFTENESYLEAFEILVPPALAWFRPDVMVIQCGGDAHFMDPLADLLLTTQGYSALFPRIIELVDSFSGGRGLFTFGGGYSLDSTPRIWALLYFLLQGLDPPELLPMSWRQRWEARTGHPLTPTLHDPPGGYRDIPRKPEISRRNRETAARLLDAAKEYWD